MHVASSLTQPISTSYPLCYSSNPKHLPNPHDGREPQRRIGIASFDGGGSRIAITAYFLERVVKAANVEIHEGYDIFVGTSAGGLLALLFTWGKTPYTIKWVVENLEAIDQAIFPPITTTWPEYLWNGFRNNINNLFHPEYNAQSFEQMAAKNFGTIRVNESYKPVLVTTWEANHLQPLQITTHNTKEGLFKNVTMAAAARFTTAAPTLFPPAEIKVGDKVEAVLEDGGMFANNPARLGLNYAAQLYPKRIFDLNSFGTGIAKTKDDSRKINPNNMGLLKIAGPISSDLLTAQTQEVHFDISQATEGEKGYTRLQVRLKDDSMTQSSPAALKAFKEVADKMWDENPDIVNEIVQGMKDRQDKAVFV